MHVWAEETTGSSKEGKLSWKGKGGMEERGNGRKVIKEGQGVMKGRKAKEGAGMGTMFWRSKEGFMHIYIYVYIIFICAYMYICMYAEETKGSIER